MSMSPNDALEVERLHPLESAAFRERLAGVAAAFDGDQMRDVLQESLLAEGASLSLEQCRLNQAIYLPRENRCNAVYELKLRDAGGTSRRHLACARVFSDPATCERYVRERLLPLARHMVGREEIAPFSAPVASVERLGMAVSVFPIDGDLPGLVRAADARRMEALFREVLRDDSGGSVRGCRVEVVRYRARKRCVLRYLVDRDDPEAPTVVYGKVLQKPGTGDIERAMLALGAIARDPQGPYRFHVPRPIACPDPELALVEGIPGDPRRMKRLLRKRKREIELPPGKLTLPGAIEICARIAAVLHTSGIPLGRPHGIERELRKLRGAIADVAPFSPAFEQRLRGWLARVEARAERSKPLAPCFGHGDFSLSQFLFDGPRGGLVDFDCMSQAEPARDVGHFLAYLRLAATRPDEATAEPSTATLRETFLTTYLEASSDAGLDPQHVRERVDLYEACTLLGLTTRKWIKFKTERLERACELLDGLDFMASG
jgi:hypothetical protein